MPNQSIVDLRFDEFDNEHKNRPKRKVNRRANTVTTSYDRSANDRNRNRVGLKIYEYRQHKIRQVALIRLESWFNCLTEKGTEKPMPVPPGCNQSLPPVIKPQYETLHRPKRRFDLSPVTPDDSTKMSQKPKKLKPGHDIDAATVHSPESHNFKFGVAESRFQTTKTI